ncbi:MAG: FGGY-family carbohydrate kinase [Rhizobiaceae bacterium]|nr:FGGY-family carbohydrate kinase [Rhizobiaceae bacterium]
MSPLVVGIDIGTSGARAAAMGVRGTIAAQAATSFGRADSTVRNPERWWDAVGKALTAVLQQIDPKTVRAIAVDGTSGTVLPVDAAGTPLAQPLMYNDAVSDQSIVTNISRLAPAESAAHGANSGLARALLFSNVAHVRKIIHQADWIAGHFSGRFDLSDDNNALKTGYDPVTRAWPDWIAETGLSPALLPEVREPGSPFGTIAQAAARRFGLPDDVVIVAGTTDGCASFLATGASKPGDGVTALGSSLTIKLLCDRPIFAPQFGIYSHRIGDTWLAGGASNTGGRVLAQFFDADRLAALSARIDPSTPSGLNYYPLPSRGERFPFADPGLEPRMSPRPGDDALFLQGLLEGIAAIEQLGYQRLAELGAPQLSSLRTVGGGAANAVWTAIRHRLLSVPMPDADSTDAAVGTARLALKGAIASGVVA